MDQNSHSKFAQILRDSTYILAVLGAGLSASSGIPTFAGQGARWRDLEAHTLATRDAFSREPHVVWEYYRVRHQGALVALPNKAHIALAELAKAKPWFLSITQNIDDLSKRAGHPLSQLVHLHGSLFSTKCFNQGCDFSELYDPTRHSTGILPHPDFKSPLSLEEKQSMCPPPICPSCNSYLRPGVTWFGELLAEEVLNSVDDWIECVPRIDVLLIVGTALELAGSAEYVYRARENGAVIAHFNLVPNEDLQEPEDFFFQGDAAETLHEIIGEVLDIP